MGRQPDARRVPPPRHLVVQALEAITTADEAVRERDACIVEMLQLGCSSRDIGDALGLSHARVIQIGKDNGWPPEDVRQARAASRAAQKRARELMEAAMDELKRQPRQPRNPD